MSENGNSNKVRGILQFIMDLLGFLLGRRKQENERGRAQCLSDVNVASLVGAVREPPLQAPS